MKNGIRLLELFAGSRSIGNEADALGYWVFSVDWEKFDKIDLAIDIEHLQKKTDSIYPRWSLGITGLQDIQHRRNINPP